MTDVDTNRTEHTRHEDDSERPALAPGWSPPPLDISVPHPHRVYDYLLGGKENYQADRDAGRELLAKVPDVVLTVRATQAFIERSITHLAQSGITQFLQVSNAIVAPYSSGQTVSHDVARAVHPDARFVYVAEDPVTIAATRASLTTSQEATQISALQEDFRDPGEFLKHPEVTDTLDLRQPVGVLLFCMLDFIADPGQASRALDTLYQWAPSGSRIALFQMLDWGIEDWTVFSPSILHSMIGAQMTLRTPQQLNDLLARYADQFDPPGLVPATQWHPDGSGPDPDQGDRCALLAAVISKH